MCSRFKQLWWSFFRLTDQLSSHEDEADGAGDVKLPSGQPSGVAFRRRHRVRLLAESVGPPQAVHAGGIVTQLWCRVWVYLLWNAQPDGGQSCNLLPDKLSDSNWSNMTFTKWQTNTECLQEDKKIINIPCQRLQLSLNQVLFLRIRC